MADAQRVLGVDARADAATLDAAYGRLVARYDPAAVFELGPEFAVLAVRRLAAITDAFELARAALGR